MLRKEDDIEAKTLRWLGSATLLEGFSKGKTTSAPWYVCICFSSLNTGKPFVNPNKLIVFSLIQGSVTLLESVKKEWVRFFLLLANFLISRHSTYEGLLEMVFIAG